MNRCIFAILVVLCSPTCQAQHDSLLADMSFRGAVVIASRGQSVTNFSMGSRDGSGIPLPANDSLITLFEPWDADLMTGQTFMGALGFVVGAFLGGGGAAVGIGGGGHPGSIILPYMAGALIGIPAAVTLLGHAHDGNGHMLAALAGALIPTGIVAGIALGGKPERSITPTEVALLVAGHLVCPVIGYHLSASEVRGPQVAPVIEPAQAGGMYHPLRPHSDIQMTFTLVRF